MSKETHITKLARELSYSIELIELFSKDKQVEKIDIQNKKLISDGVYKLNSTDYFFELSNGDIIGFLRIKKIFKGFFRFGSDSIKKNLINAVKDCFEKNYKLFRNEKVVENILNYDLLDKTYTINEIEDFIIESFEEINSIKIIPFSLDKNNALFDWNLNYDYELKITHNIPTTYCYISVISTFSPQLFNEILEKLLSDILQDYYSNRIIRAVTSLNLDSDDNIIADSKEQIKFDAIFGSIKRFFNCSYISFWKKEIQNDNIYKFVQGTKELNAKDNSIANIEFKPNPDRPYCISTLNFESKNDSNKEFYNFAHSNGFLSSYYVPINDYGTNIQNGILIIFSRIRIEQLSKKTNEFLQDIVKNINDLLTWDKINSLSELKKHLPNEDTSKVIKEVLKEIGNSILAKSVFLYPNNEVISIKDDFIFSGEMSPQGSSIILENRTTNFNLINEVFSDFDKYYCITNKKDFRNFIIKQVGKKNFSEKRFKNSFFFRDGIAAFIVFHIKSYDEEKSIGAIFINFDNPIKNKGEYEQLVKFYAYYIGELLNMHNYKVLIQNKLQIEKLRRKFERDRSKNIELKKEEIENLYLNKMPDFFRTEYFLILQTLMHDIKSLLGSSKDAWDEFKNELSSKASQDLLDKVKLSSKVLGDNEKRIKDILKLFEFDQANEESKIKISDLVKRLKSFFTPESYDEEKKRLVITIKKMEDEPKYLVNKTMFSMIFYNLFTNAIYALDNFFEEGIMEIDINIHFKNSYFTILFSDNGPGIQGIAENELFELGKTSKGEDGLGIGLFFIREIIENNMNGNIRYYRKNNKSNFELTFPQKY